MVDLVHISKYRNALRWRSIKPPTPASLRDGIDTGRIPGERREGGYFIDPTWRPEHMVMLPTDLPKAELARRRQVGFQRATERPVSRVPNSVGLLHKSVVSRARSKGWRYLTATQLVQLWDRCGGHCQVTGHPFDLKGERRGDSHRNPYAPSLDRIDVKKGYELENCRLVMLGVNIAINDFGDKWFDTMCRAYIEHTDGESVEEYTATLDAYLESHPAWHA